MGGAPSSTLKEAVRLHQAGELGRAEALYKQAIAAAHAAFKPWSKLLAKERSQVLRRWYNLIIEHVEAAIEAVAATDT